MEDFIACWLRSEITDSPGSVFRGVAKFIGSLASKNWEIYLSLCKDVGQRDIAMELRRGTGNLCYDDVALSAGLISHV